MKDIFNDIKKGWMDLLAIAIASGLTPSMIEWLGWPDNFWIFIGRETEDGRATICQLEASMININPAWLVNLIKCCKIYNVFSASHEFPSSCCSDIVNWE